MFHWSCILHWSGCCEARRCCRRDVLHNCILCGIHGWISDAYGWRGTHVLHQSGGEVYPARAGEMYSMTGTVSEKLATGAGEMFSTTGTATAQTSGAGEVYSMAETGADDTFGAEGTILGIFGRIQEVSNCCLPFPPACITDRRAHVEVRERCLPLELGRTSLWLPPISWL